MNATADTDDARDGGTDATRYYFVSDLHIGGDETLQQVDFMDEFLDFLRDLETTDEDAELIVNGDAFGLWEFTEIEGFAKFDALVDRYPELFEQLRATGETVPITSTASPNTTSRSNRKSSSRARSLAASSGSNTASNATRTTPAPTSGTRTRTRPGTSSTSTSRVAPGSSPSAGSSTG
jgi:hypothetical protein